MSHAEDALEDGFNCCIVSFVSVCGWIYSNCLFSNIIWVFLVCLSDGPKIKYISSAQVLKLKSILMFSF